MRVTRLLLLVPFLYKKIIGLEFISEYLSTPCKLFGIKIHNFNHANSSVRQLATSMFANLIKLIPLDNENMDENQQDLPKNLLELKLKQKSFIDELMSLKNVKDINMPVKIDAELRSYQIDGIKWLSFLNR